MYITVAIDADLSVSDAGGTPSSSNSGIIFVYFSHRILANFIANLVIL